MDSDSILKPIRIDGSQGEGGGQVVRTALALAMLTGRAVSIDNIRASRQKPGLLRQHLTAATAAAEICGGHLEGAEMRSRSLTLYPNVVRHGRYGFDIGTAGSTALVLQTVLFPLLTTDGPSTVILEGGTHNPKAPTFEFLERCFLPLIRRLGPTVHARLERPGFFPRGGGRLVVEIEPVDRLTGFELHERGVAQHRMARAKVAGLPMHIAERMIARFQKRMSWPDRQLWTGEIHDSLSPGAVLLVELAFQHVTEILVGFGEIGVRAERIAEKVAKETRRYLESPSPVGPYLADQLLLPLALAGSGGFTTRELSLHARTQLELIPIFLDVSFKIEEIEVAGGSAFRISVEEPQP